MADTNVSSSDQPAEPFSPPARPPRWPGWLALFLFCFCGASAGFFSTAPLYRSEGLVLIRHPPSLMNDNPPPPVDRVDLEREAALANSNRVIDWATFQLAGNKPASPHAIEAFGRQLEARVDPTGFLHIAFLDPNPTVAANSATAATNAYFDASRERLNRIRRERFGWIEDRRSEIQARMTELQKRLDGVSEPYGPLRAGQFVDAQIQEAQRLEREIWIAQGSPNSTTRPAELQRLIDRRKEVQTQAAESSKNLSAIQSIQREQEDAQKELATLISRARSLQMEASMGSPIELHSTGNIPTTPAFDNRPRNTAIGFVASLIAFFILRALWRSLRNRYRVVSARTAFTLIITHTPKPVIPVEQC
jgi:uncharacterized protein involved in exopolysaccharide biosynthesis